jgi:hypothetical protein
MVPLPAACPELNAAENIWQYLRQTYLSNRVFKTYTDILDASQDAWPGCGRSRPRWLRDRMIAHSCGSPGLAGGLDLARRRRRDRNVLRRRRLFAQKSGLLATGM